MGKQLHLLEIIKKLISLKTNKNFKDYKIKEIGLKEGEKLKENLSINSRLKSTIQKDIFIANEPNYPNHKIISLKRDIYKYLEKNDDNKLKKIMINFLRKEIYKYK